MHVSVQDLIEVCHTLQTGLDEIQAVQINKFNLSGLHKELKN